MASAETRTNSALEGRDTIASPDTIPTTEETVELPPKDDGVAKEDPVKFVQSLGQTVYFTLAQEKRVLRKIDSRVLPIMLGAYFLQQLDKSSLSYSSVFDIQKDANLKGSEYSWLGSILYLSQLVMQPLGAVFLVKFPLGKLISIAIFCWGISLCGMAGCRNFKGLLATRFLLGSFEAVIGPSLIAVTQIWWRRSEQTLRLSLWSAMNGVAFIIGSLSTYGLGHIYSSTLFSYQIIFLFCGCLTLAFSVVAFCFMPDSPLDAKFWDEGEDLIAIERIRANQMGVGSRTWRWDHALETFLDLKTWCWFITALSISIPAGGFGTFGPLIVQSFGFDKFHTILFNTPFGAVQIIAILGSGWLATKTKSKGLALEILLIPCIVGCVLILKVTRTAENRGVLLFAYYLLSFSAGITPLIYSWSSQNTGGDTKRKCTTGIVFIGMCAGNVIGPLLYSTEEAPLYTKGLVADLSMFCILGLLVLKHAYMREQVGKSATVIDESMMAKSEIQKTGKEVETLHIEDNGLNDVADLKNEDFIYVY